MVKLAFFIQHFQKTTYCIVCSVLILYQIQNDKQIMDNIELSKTLRESARHHGLCNEWYDEWSDSCSPSELVAKMFKGLDFCLKNHWPSNDFIKERFNIYFLRKVNVFVDDKYSNVNPEQCLILGSSEITTRFNGTSIGNIHVRDDSCLKLTARNRSFVIIHLYEKASITAKQFDIAHVVIIKHSNDTIVNVDQNIRIKEEYDYLKK